MRGLRGIGSVLRRAVRFFHFAVVGILIILAALAAVVWIGLGLTERKEIATIEYWFDGFKNEMGRLQVYRGNRYLTSKLTILNRLAAEIHFGIALDQPFCGSVDVMRLTCEFPVEGLQARPWKEWDVCDVGLSYGVNLTRGGVLAWSAVEWEAKRAGLSEDEVRRRAKWPRRYIALTAPIWLVLLIIAAHPIILLVRGPICRWLRLRRGQCVECGYDLRGNVSGVCSECGAALEQGSKRAVEQVKESASHGS